MSPRWLHWPAAAAAAEWSVYKDGIFRVDNWNVNDTTGVTLTVLESSTSYATPTDNFYSSPTRGRYYNTGGYPDWIAIWHITGNAWIGAFQVSAVFSTAPNLVVRWGAVGSHTMTAGDSYIIVYQTQDPSFSVSWASYDGPTS